MPPPAILAYSSPTGFATATLPFPSHSPPWSARPTPPPRAFAGQWVASFPISTTTNVPVQRYTSAPTAVARSPSASHRSGSVLRHDKRAGGDLEGAKERGKAKHSSSVLRRRGDGYPDDFGPGDYGWGTDFVYKTVTVLETNYYPIHTTVYTTYGVEQTAVITGNIVTISVYEGADTTITLTPDVRTLTLYPTETYTVVQGTTIYLTSMSTQFVVEQGTTTVTHPAPSPTTTQGGESGSDGGDVTTTWVTESGSSSSFSRRSTATSTSTSIPTPHETWMGAVQAPCRPGDAEESIPGIFSLTPDNKITLWVIAIYIVGITIAWNLFLVRWLIYPWKTLIVFYHELGHLLAMLAFRIPILGFSLDPNRGGGSFGPPHTVYPGAVLHAGQLTSIAFGAGFLYAGFDTYASKIASFIIGVTFLPVIFFQRELLYKLLVFAGAGLLIGLWFLVHATGLRYYVLFCGVMSLLYIIWDTIDDRLHRKANPCCVIQMEINMPKSDARTWFLIWFTAALIVMVGITLAALATLRLTPHGMYCKGQTLLPT